MSKVTAKDVMTPGIIYCRDTEEDLFQTYAKKGDNAAVKQFASRALPVIKQHLDEAKKLSQ
jgi:predicted outer membrane protein